MLFAKIFSGVISGVLLIAAAAVLIISRFDKSKWKR